MSARIQNNAATAGDGKIKLLNNKLNAKKIQKSTFVIPLADDAKNAANSSGSSSCDNSPKKRRRQDHYVLKTIKHESAIDGANAEIDFELSEVGESAAEASGNGPSVLLTEELNMSDSEAEEEVEKTQEFVEHVCGKCYKSFRRISGLKHHLEFCRYDSGYHLRKAEMLKNLEKIEKDAIKMENKDICFCCGESYDVYHLGHINCPDCTKSFKTQASYERHIFITHSESNDHPCKTCNAKLRSDNLLKLHVEQHEKSGKPYACKICGKDFTRSYHLKRHQKYSACLASESDALSCRVCDKSFFRLDNLRSHLRQHLGTHATKKQEYMCPICKNCFYSLSTLNIHTRTHTGERPFDCDLCDKKFPSLVALKKHRRYHTGEKPYHCSECNHSFAVKEVLNRHMKRHTGERPHSCAECGKGFIQASQLRCHERTHLKPFECSECTEKFKTEKQLIRHSKCHKVIVKHKFQCEYCCGYFVKLSQLKKHMDLGLDGHPPKSSKQKERTDCAICEKNFDTAKHLHFHILKVHEVDPSEFVNEKPQDEARSAEAAAEIEEILGGADNHNNNQANNNTDGGVVLKEFIVNELTPINQETIIMQNEAYTVIPLDSNSSMEIANGGDSKPAGIFAKKSLAESLAAAIADNDNGDDFIELITETKGTVTLSAEDLQLQVNVGKLLDMLVDKSTLKSFGWPGACEELVIRKVIRNCGHNLSKDENGFREYDYASRMREYVKLLLTVVVQNDSIKDLLNNYSIDEVIEYVLGSAGMDTDDSDKDD